MADKFTVNGITKNLVCKECGDDNDLMIAFTKYQVCGACTNAGYNKAMRIGRN